MAARTGCDDDADLCLRDVVSKLRGLAACEITWCRAGDAALAVVRGAQAVGNARPSSARCCWRFRCGVARARCSVRPGLPSTSLCLAQSAQAKGPGCCAFHPRGPSVCRQMLEPRSRADHRRGSCPLCRRPTGCDRNTMTAAGPLHRRRTLARHPLRPVRSGSVPAHRAAAPPPETAAAPPSHAPHPAPHRKDRMVG